MPSVFLTNAPYTLEERYGKLASIGATLPCLGLLSLGAVLRKAGHRVRVLDASALGLSYDAVLREVSRFKPNVVGLSAVTPSINRTARLARRIKRALPHVPIVLGGPHVTAMPEKTLESHPPFDYGVIGEGERTIVELVDALGSGKRFADISGTIFRKDGDLFLGGPASRIEDLDSLPFPAWDLLDEFPGRYRPAVFKYKKRPSTHVVSSRGCPGRCIFCDTSVFGRHVRFHSSEYVLEMAGYLHRRFGIRDIIFEDDQFLLKHERVAKICEGLIKANLPISWSCSGRVNAIKDLELLQMMKRSGCWLINYGIESGNQEILDFAGKGITLDQVKKAVSLTEKAGISSKGYFILGLPLETKKTMSQTIRFAKTLPLNDVSVFMLTPFPGSCMYEIAENHGSFDQDFDRMNVLDVVYTPNGLSRDMLLRYQHRFMRRFYLRPKIIGNYLTRLAGSPANVADMAKATFGFLRHVST